MFFRPANKRFFRSSNIVFEELKFNLNRPRKGESNYLFNGAFPFDKNGVLALP
jgi:hypothetical protein